MVIRLILLILGFCLFLLAGLGLSHPRLNLVALGLACWVAAEVFGSFGPRA